MSAELVLPFLVLVIDDLHSFTTDTKVAIRDADERNATQR
jgi:hypothetical protein